MAAPPPPGGLSSLAASKPYFRLNTQMAAHMPMERAPHLQGGVVHPPAMVKPPAGLHALAPHFALRAPMPRPLASLASFTRGLR